MKTRICILILPIIALSVFSCGRAPSSLLRQGQLPVYDFPLYLSEGALGNIWKYERNATRTLLVSGLNDPRGIATDRFGNLFVAEYGGNRLLKVNTADGSTTVVMSGLSAPSMVAVDSFGEAYVGQDTPMTITRSSDGQVKKTYSSIPSAFVFGVEDLLIVGLFDQDRVYWGDSSTATAADPVNVALDGTGRVYVAEGTATDARVLRFHQRAPGSDTGVVVADQLLGPRGIAVDPVGNIYVVEQGAGRIVLITHEGVLYSWVSNVVDPQYLAFTQY